MKNCIFCPHCTELICDESCPTLVETSYLLERNGINIHNPVFNMSATDMAHAQSIIHNTNGQLGVVISDETISFSNILTYCAICENWQGNRLHCTVYHLKLSNHIDLIQRSWSTKDTPEQLEYEQIWSSTAKILIISNLDYVQFKDFQAQTLLNLIHNRQNNGLTTIVVSPKLQSLIGSGMFFSRLQSMLDKAVLKI